MSVIEAINLHKTFQCGKKSIEAVKNVTFKVNPGEIKGLVGASGSGKTTVLNLLLSILKPDRGQVNLGTPVGYTPQDPFAALPGYFIVRQCVAEPLYFLRQKLSRNQIEEKVEAVLNEVNLDVSKYGDLIPSQLSGGERQRVLIARALIVEPQSLVFDEPTSMVDENLKNDLTELIRNISVTHNPAIFLVTHDIKMAASLCRELMIMKDGQIIERGFSNDLIENPISDYAKALVNSAFDLESYWNE
jgi:ABC-type glutathione transport system ATPase component